MCCLPVLEIRLICVSHDKSEEMSTPRYFGEDTDSSMQLWRMYCVWIRVFGPSYVSDFAFRGVKTWHNESHDAFMMNVLIRW